MADRSGPGEIQEHRAYLRKQSRETQIPQAPAGKDEREFADEFFDQAPRDHWHTFPPILEDPERSFEPTRFWEVFERCHVQLPAQTAQVFAMREFMVMETGDICKALGISPTHCWVILYRARMSLHACLETAWFGPEEKIGAAK